jgi:hypothetical protein
MDTEEIGDCPVCGGEKTLTVTMRHRGGDETPTGALRSFAVAGKCDNGCQVPTQLVR